jgi:hypothetical protein
LYDYLILSPCGNTGANEVDMTVVSGVCVRVCVKVGATVVSQPGVCVCVCLCVFLQVCVKVGAREKKILLFKCTIHTKTKMVLPSQQKPMKYAQFNTGFKRKKKGLQHSIIALKKIKKEKREE